jgi:ankyrin repeat protein
MAAWLVLPAFAGELHVAVRAGDIDQVRQLLAQGAKVNERDTLGGSALHDACWGGDVKMVRLLLDHKADPNLPHKEGGSTPLHYAIITNHPDIVTLLLARGAKLNAVSGSGSTALHLAASRGYAGIVALLLEKGMDVNLADASGATPLEEAAWKGERDVVALLLKHKAAPGKALIPAAARGHADVVKLLLDAGVDPTAAVDGATALGEAVKFKQLEVTKLLLATKAGADPETRNKLLGQAVIRGDEPIVRLFLDHGDSARTPYLLHDAALKGHLEVAALLLERGADPKGRNAQGATALHDAALAGHAAMVALLIKSGAPVNAQESETHATPLHHAASFGRIEVVRLLLEQGADPSIKNKAGETALQAALAQGHMEAARLLQK